MKKLSGKRNLHKVFDLCNLADKADAMNSYFRYRDICAEIAKNHNSTLKVVAAVFSALSPNNDYIGNVRDAISVMAFRCGRIDQPKVHTYRQNLNKALEIAFGRLDPMHAFPALKTKNFFRNILDPEDPEWVTIDGHMINAFRMDKKANVKGLKFNDKQYEEIKECVIELAMVEKLLPNQFQAICWVSWKAMNGRKYSRQTELMPMDAWLSGLSFAWRKE